MSDLTSLTADQLHARANALLLETLKVTRQRRELAERQTAIDAEVAAIDARLHALAKDGVKT